MVKEHIPNEEDAANILACYNGLYIELLASLNLPIEFVGWIVNSASFLVVDRPRGNTD